MHTISHQQPCACTQYEGMQTYCFTVVNVMSTAVAVSFLSKIFRSLHSFKNLELSINGSDPFPALKVQKLSNISSSEPAIVIAHSFLV